MQATDFHPQKDFCCPCLLNVLDNIFDSGFWSLDEIITHLQNLKKYRVDKKRFDDNLQPAFESCSHCFI